MIRSFLSRNCSAVHLKRLGRCCYHEVSFAKNGDPQEVLGYHSDSAIDDQKVPDAVKGEQGMVRVQMEAAPWNPADMNTVQGRYPSPYSNGAKKDPKSLYFADQTVAGSEGWGRVTEILSDGSKDKHMDVKVGDWVTLGLAGMGTMRSSLWVPSYAVVPLQKGEEFFRQSQSLPGGSVSASTFFQLGGTALRMLRDFESLEDGDIVIQNAGNSGVGFLLSQLAAMASEKVIYPVSLIRRGGKTQEEYNIMVDHLTTIGKNALVVAEEDLLQDKDALKKFRTDLKNLSDRPPKLAVNAVGGDSASLLLQLVGPGRTMVTYGGMSMKPVTLGTAQLIFKDVKAAGYWHSRWMVQQSLFFPNDQRHAMINELVDLSLQGKIKNAPTKAFNLSQVSEALDFEKAQSSVTIRQKIAFDCRE